MLVNCVVYKEGKKVRAIPVDEISEHIKDKDSFVWVALKDSDQAELEHMQREFNLHELSLEDAFKGHQRPKIEEYGDSLFVVLKTIEITSEGHLETGEVDIFVGPHYVLSVRNNYQRGFAPVRDRCEREPELLKYGPAFVLYALMDTVVDRYLPIIEHLEDELESLEDRIFSNKSSIRSNIEDLYELKRKLVLVQHLISPLIEAVGKLYGGRVPQLCVGMHDYYRDVYDHVVRINKAIENTREISTTAIQVNLSMITLSESEVGKKLAAYAALFAVPTAIAGIYGMNFDYMPELKMKFGYPIILSIIVIIDVVLWFKFRKARWL